MGTIATGIANGNANIAVRGSDRTSKNVLWEVTADGASPITTSAALTLRYSTDGGTTWNSGGALANGSGSTTYANDLEPSLYIDKDDFIWVTFCDNNSGSIYLYRGTFNTAHTSVTWSAIQTVSSSNCRRANLVVLRNPFTAGAWVGVITFALRDSGQVYTRRIDCTSAGAITFGTQEQQAQSYTSGTGINPAPVVDFQHTGDGKTAANGTPRFYLAWSNNNYSSTPTTEGIRMKSATFTANAIAWQTESTVFGGGRIPAITNSNFWINAFFDGTRFVICGWVGGSTNYLFSADRDAADTTINARTHVADGSGAYYMQAGDATFDQLGNLHFFGLYSGGLRRRIWTRAGAVLSDQIQVNTDNGIYYARARRGTYTSATTPNTIDLIYNTNNGSNFNLISQHYVVDIAPNAPTLLSPADNASLPREAAITVSSQFSDPDGGDTASSCIVRYRVSGTSKWTYATGTVSGTTLSYTFPAGTTAGKIDWGFMAIDTFGLLSSAWSATRSFTATAPTGGLGSLGKTFDPIAILGFSRTGATGPQKVQGTYIADGNARSIDVGFAPDLVIISSITNYAAGMAILHRTDARQTLWAGGSNTQILGGDVLTGSGFSLIGGSGTQTTVNQNGVTYGYTAFKFV